MRDRKRDSRIHRQDLAVKHVYGEKLCGVRPIFVTRAVLWADVFTFAVDIVSVHEGFSVAILRHLYIPVDPWNRLLWSRWDRSLLFKEVISTGKDRNGELLNRPHLEWQFGGLALAHSIAACSPRLALNSRAIVNPTEYIRGVYLKSIPRLDVCGTEWLLRLA